MSNIVTTIPAIRSPHMQSQQSDHSQSAQDDAPDEPQVTVNSSTADEPLLAD
ncbi:MAG: hypothetical protein R3F19_27140 [Verrucomicrobiales bacterium]|nr:hypothetical protein [Verrucomicrobiae bacterium]